MNRLMYEGHNMDYYSVKLSYPQVCNYSCTYCSRRAKVGEVKEPVRDYAFFVHDFIKSLPGPVKLGIVGNGEPSLYKTTEMLTGFLGQNVIDFVVMTNFTASVATYLKYIENNPDIIRISATWHPDSGNEADFYAKALQLQEHLFINFMFTPGRVEKQIPQYYSFGRVALMQPQVIHLNGVLADYSDEEIDLIGTLYGDITHRKFHFNGKKYSALQLYHQKKHSFKNWECFGANRLLSIDGSGNLTQESCGVDLGNIYSTYSIPHQENKLCSNKVCNCYFKLILEKRQVFSTQKSN